MISSGHRGQTVPSCRWQAQVSVSVAPIHLDQILVALNSMLDLVSHFSDVEPSERAAVDAFFFQRARSLFGLDLLDSEKGSVAIVQTLLVFTLFC